MKENFQENPSHRSMFRKLEREKNKLKDLKLHFFKTPIHQNAIVLSKSFFKSDNLEI